MSDHASNSTFRPEGFGRKVGPLPLWAWAVILAAGAFIFYRFFMSGGSGAQTTGTSLDTLGYGTTGTSGSGAVSSADSGSDPASSLFSNEAWQAAAIHDASQFGATGIQIQQATDAYLNGKTLTTQQADWINKILAMLGAAPNGTAGTPVVGDGKIHPKPPGPVHNLPKPKPSKFAGLKLIKEKGQERGVYNPANGREIHVDNSAEYNYIHALMGNYNAVPSGLTSAQISHTRSLLAYVLGTTNSRPKTELDRKK